jgi:chaperonin cofactor prefoldin
VSAIAEAVERIARVEERLQTLVKQVEHIDLCVDDLKRTIWKATGMVTAVVLLAGWAFK